MGNDAMTRKNQEDIDKQLLNDICQLYRLDFCTISYTIILHSGQSTGTEPFIVLWEMVESTLATETG